MAALTELGIDVNMFYCVNFFAKSNIKLQGELTGETRKNCEFYGFEFELSKDNNWLSAKIVNNDTVIEAVLTF
jgi:hypothetical protein